MYSDSGIKKILLLGFVLFVLATGFATALNIDVVNEPLNKDYVSNGTDTVRIVNVTDNNEPLDEQDIGDAFHTNYTYNATGGEPERLEHLASGYWYAEFTPLKENGSYVDYLVREKTGTEDEATATESMSYGNYTVELMSNTGSQITPGEEINLRVNVTDEAAGEPETGATATAYFTNGTHTLDIQELGNSDGSEYYNSGVNVPENYGGNYILHINVSNSADSHLAPEGAVSVPVRMEPPMRGDIQYLQTNAGCDNSSFFTECEREATISTGYNVTGAVPNSVNLSIEAMNRSSGEWETQESMEMENNSIYESEFQIPDLNNTAYERDIKLVYNATGSEVNAVEQYTITVRGYQVRFGAASSTRQGGEYNLELAFEKYFSSQAVEASRVEADINVSNSTDTLRQFNLSDMEYENGIFQRDVQVGSEWPEGTYDIDVEAEDIYGNVETASDSFFVREVDRTFEVGDDIEEEVVTAGVYEFNVSVENLGSSELNISTNASEDIQGFTQMDSYVQIPGDEEQNITVEFNLSGMMMEDKSGELVLEDEGGYNETLDVDLEIPDCDYREGPYCVEGDLNQSADERGNVLEDFDVYYLANASDEATVQLSATGNLSDVMSFSPEEAVMNSSNNEQTFVANYSALAPGYYSGQVDIGTLSIPVQFDSNVESTELSVQVTDSLNLGTVVEGDSVTEEIDIENTGDVQVETVSFESDSMSVSAESSTISPGSSETFELELAEITGSGVVTVTAESATQETSQDIQVAVETVPDLEEQASGLREQLNELQSQDGLSSDAQNTLNTASLNITEVENEFNAGNYEEAQAIYEATEANLQQVRSSANSGGDTTDSSEPSDPSDPSQPGPQPSSPNQDSGGSTLIIVGVVIFILLLVGFVFVTSYVPEEGDPLYGVLGQ